MQSCDYIHVALVCGWPYEYSLHTHNCLIKIYNYTGFNVTIITFCFARRIIYTKQIMLLYVITFRHTFTFQSIIYESKVFFVSATIIRTKMKIIMCHKYPGNRK